MKVKTNAIGLSQVCEVIASLLGLNFPVERWDMLAHSLALSARGFGFNTIDTFIEWLTTAKLTKEDIEILALHLTVSETYFWREPQVFSALTDSILPELTHSRKNGNKTIRIWSAGCSTGEEAYSLAIALHRSFPDLNDWKVLILATDINQRSLQKAIKGIYSKWSFRNCPSWFKSTYFHSLTDGNYQVILPIRDMVRFTSLNLTDDSYPSPETNTQAMDIIFCRNVLMYFTEEWVDKISRNFFHSLNPDGWFVVSSCELSSQVFPKFAAVNFPGAILYNKSKKEFSFSETLPQGITFSDLPVLSTSIIQASPEPALPFFVPDSALFSGNDLQASSFEDNIIPIAKPEPVIDDGLTALSDYKPAIRFMANQGDLSEALSLCNKAIEGDKLAVGYYFLRAMILQELDKTNESVSSLKQSIYIDPEFIMGHFALGNLMIRQGKDQMAKRYFNNVLGLISKSGDDEILLESEGLSVKYVREIILANMIKYSIQ